MSVRRGRRWHSPPLPEESRQQPRHFGRNAPQQLDMRAIPVVTNGNGRHTVRRDKKIENNVRPTRVRCFLRSASRAALCVHHRKSPFAPDQPPPAPRPRCRARIPINFLITHTPRLCSCFWRAHTFRALPPSPSGRPFLLRPLTNRRGWGDVKNPRKPPTTTTTLLKPHDATGHKRTLLAPPPTTRSGRLFPTTQQLNTPTPSPTLKQNPSQPQTPQPLATDCIPQSRGLPAMPMVFLSSKRADATARFFFFLAQRQFFFRA